MLIVYSKRLGILQCSCVNTQLPLEWICGLLPYPVEIEKVCARSFSLYLDIQFANPVNLCMNLISWLQPTVAVDASRTSW
jgi:hypothetical protein